MSSLSAGPMDNQEHSSSADPGELKSHHLVLGKRLHSLPCGAFLHEGTYKWTKVYVKVVPLEKGDELPKKFVKEVAARKRIIHPVLITGFIGTCCITSTACIVTEYFDMRSVKTYIDEGKTKWEQIRRVVRVALKVAEAMKFIHDKGVIHFNLKMDSIVVCESPSGYKSFKLANLDFITLESEATPTGTPKHENYECMAPEVLRGDHFDRRADVYSFGIMLCELLMKGKPYGFMTPMEVVNKGILGQIPNLPKKWKKMYPRLPALIETCCKFNRTQRPSFHEIEEQLKEMEEEALNHIFNQTCFRCMS